MAAPTPADAADLQVADRIARAVRARSPGRPRPDRRPAAAGLRREPRTRPRRARGRPARSRWPGVAVRPGLAEAAGRRRAWRWRRGPRAARWWPVARALLAALALGAPARRAALVGVAAPGSARRAPSPRRRRPRSTRAGQHRRPVRPRRPATDAPPTRGGPGGRWRARPRERRRARAPVTVRVDGGRADVPVRRGRRRAPSLRRQPHRHADVPRPASCASTSGWPAPASSPTASPWPLAGSPTGVRISRSHDAPTSRSARGPARRAASRTTSSPSGDQVAFDAPRRVALRIAARRARRAAPDALDAPVSAHRTRPHPPARADRVAARHLEQRAVARRLEPEVRVGAAASRRGRAACAG